MIGQSVIDEDWTGRDLAGDRFDDCRFLRCIFSRADLREVTFKNCGFADVEGQQGANFAFARLDEATFENCAIGSDVCV